MQNDQTSVKAIIRAIEEYYSGKQITDICKYHDINEEVFNNWLAAYKYIVFELMEFKLENERLRKMFIEVSLKLYEPQKRKLK